MFLANGKELVLQSTPERELLVETFGDNICFEVLKLYVTYAL